jgi:5-(carboxyamino)imidazole ribonucleotide synthase
MSDPAPVVPGGVVGILGGGQLGRMLAIAAARMGLKAHIYCPEADPPAADVAAAATRGAYDDQAALRAFSETVDVVTYEFENVPAAPLAALTRPLFPGVRALEVAQDRVDEKTFLNGIGVPTAPFRTVDTAADLTAALEEIGAGVLKTRRFGYDGKGQVRLAPGDDPEAALEEIAHAPAIFEGWVAFEREVSVIVARARDGAVTCFDPAENVHRDGILHTSTVPGAVTSGKRAEAALLAGRIANALDYVGVMGVELFQTSSGFLVNEIAPRVHNSGHWTIEACIVDQFEQHIRAICGWPLGDGSRHSDAVMTNLIGAEADDWKTLAADPSAALHLYGKSESRPGRKMGHLTRLSPKS